MKVLVVASILFLVFSAGVAGAAGGVLTSPGQSAGAQPADLTGKLAAADFEPSCSCCDIAYMDAFAARGLAYVRTAEFAESVRRVASGESGYSPAEIPREWKAFAAEMVRRRADDANKPASARSLATAHLAADSHGLRLLREERCLIPALIYLGSLDYRVRTGRRSLTPAFPGIVRTAARELDGRVAEKRRMAATFARRAAAIREKIAAAEAQPGSDCSPGDVARARSELDNARREAANVRSSLAQTEFVFASAESISDELTGACSSDASVDAATSEEM